MLLTLSSDDFLALAADVLRRGETLRFRATGTSMEPFVRGGDVLEVSPAEGSQIAPGDVVLYRAGQDPRVHRVSGRKGEVLWVRGDAPGCLPEAVPAAEVLGRVGGFEREGREYRLDRGGAGLMRWPVARVAGGRWLARATGGWICSFRERRTPDGFRRLLRFCALADDMARPDREGTVARVLPTAEAHGLSPLLYFRVRQKEPDPDVAPELKRAYYVAAARNAVLSEALETALKAMGEAGVETMVLKGAALAETVYPDPACRPMTDLDLLIRPEGLRAADGALTSLGYVSVDGALDRIDPFLPTPLSTLDYRAPDPILPPIHLHWHLVNTSIPVDAYRDRIDMEEVWADALPFRLAGPKAFRMSSHHQVVYLCEHALRPAHAFSRGIHLLDLALALPHERNGPEWDRIADAALRFGLDRLVFLGLLIVRGGVGVAVPEEVLERLRPACLTFGESVFLRRVIAGRGRPGVSYVVHLALRRTLGAKAGFLFRTLFPSPEVRSHHRHEGRLPFFLRRPAEVARSAAGICGLSARERTKAAQWPPTE